MIELLDYILDNDDNFWIVNNITDNVYKGFMIYKVSNDGKVNNITRKKYIKANDNDGIIEVPKEYKKIFKPQKFYKQNKKNLNGMWKDYVNVLNEIGIKDEDIGIFGSYLIGFDITKDIDFVIYGKDNLHKYYESINYIRNKLKVTSISLKHIDYQYNKHKVKFNDKCDLKEIISRNWSGIQLENDVLSTPRFIDKENMNVPSKKGLDKVIKVKVKEGIYTAMLPRKALVEYNDNIYTIYSTLWKFQSFAYTNDILEIYGNVDNKNKLIILDDCKYYIRYLYKSESVL